MLGEEAAITSFSGEWEFLSNFSESPIEWRGHIWPTVEHAYQASKAIFAMDRAKIMQAKTPGQAKRIGQQISCRPDWEEIKVERMLDLLRKKFSQEPFKSALLQTGKAELIEGNWWGDTFWGVSKQTGIGENMLGKLLMQVRSELE
jgi:ribA/ribD-fused uncharacterized protein